MKAIVYKGEKLYINRLLKLQTRRARTLGISPPIPDDVQSIFSDALGSGTCHYCGCEFVMGNPLFHPTLDHKTPLSKGGTNKIDNFVVCCMRCNRLKRVLDYDAFIFILSKMDDYMRYADSEILRNRFSNRFRELKAEYLITGGK
jgi:hypothetical protein